MSDSGTRSPSLRKIAIVLQTASTGGWRYVRRLAEGLRGVDPHLEITCYLGPQVDAVFASDRPRESLQAMQVSVLDWRDPTPPGEPRKGHGVKRWLQHRKQRQERRDQNERYDQFIAELDKHDVVFFAWPYFMASPVLKTAMAFIPHDFNYAHFTGLFIATRPAYESLLVQHEYWLRIAHPVVSSPFIAGELKRVFPQSNRDPRVIYLSRLGSHPPVEPLRAKQIVADLGVEGDYILNLNNITPHKNLGQVIGGFYHCLESHPDLKLIVAGFGTEGIRGRANNPLYIDNCEENWNVASLGLVSDEQVTALIQCSRLVINASLYEAGNGSGLDAWALGTPVAMSSIPPFLEQMEFLGVEACVFDPRCCYQIRDAILNILNEPEQAAKSAERSRLAMDRYDWQTVAQHYRQFFEDIIHVHRGS